MSTADPRSAAATSRAARTYREEAVLTASREKLVAMLCQRAIRDLESVVVALEDPARRRAPETGDGIARAHDVIAELRGALDLDAGGELAENLDSIYEFCLDRLTEANSSREAQPIHHALTAVRPLEEAWRELVPS